MHKSGLNVGSTSDLSPDLSGNSSTIQQPSTERKKWRSSHYCKTMTVLLIVTAFYYIHILYLHVYILDNNNNNNAEEKMTDISLASDIKINNTNIPPNFIINTKAGLHNEPLLIQQNVQNNLLLFPNYYKFIADNDTTCLQKMKQIPTFAKSNHTLSWFQNKETPGMLKSDACRLAQLYIHGGIYLDNDLELKRSIVDLIQSGYDGGGRRYDVITSVELQDRDIFQAILAASPGHALIQRSMEIMIDEIPKIDYELAWKTGWLGPKSMRMAMEDLYGYKVNKYKENQRNMSEHHGVFLLKEEWLESSHSMMRKRSMDNVCNIAITNGTTVYGFSRVKEYGTADKKCSTA